MYPPPCTQAITGKASPVSPNASVGTHTFKFRQSNSDCLSSGWFRVDWLEGCGSMGPYLVASSAPAFLSSKASNNVACLQRAGICAKGTPKKLVTAPSEEVVPLIDRLPTLTVLDVIAAISPLETMDFPQRPDREGLFNDKVWKSKRKKRIKSEERSGLLRSGPS